MSGRARRAALFSVLLLAACASVPPPQPPPPAPSEPAPVEPALQPYGLESVWTRSADVAISLESGRVELIPYLFTRLDVLGRDGDALVATCRACPWTEAGRVLEADVIGTHLAPEISAWGEFPEFLLALRDAVVRRDLEALRPVMSPDFTFSLVGSQTPDVAFRAWWSENFTSFDRIPALLDRGVTTRDGRIWAAPPEFLLDYTYQGLRAGFRKRLDGRWEWIYLMRGIL